MNLKLKIWRQKDAKDKGGFEEYHVENISPDTSFLEMLDILNNNLIHEGKAPVAFDHDCREGICGACSLHINGRAHGPEDDVTTCQLHMRRFKDGDTIVIEPWRSAAFPVVKDLVVNRTAFDQIMQAGGFVSINTGGVPDANAIPIPKKDADESMDAASCIGCGPAWPPARTVRRCCSSRRGFRRWPSCRRDGSKRPAGPRRWWRRWTSWVSATARTPERANRNARRGFPSPTSPG